MSTAPFDESVAQLLAQTHQQSLRVVAVLSDATELPLDVLDWSIDWDETRAPRVHAAFDVPPPADQATLDQLDPRLLVRLLVFASYRLPGGQVDEHQVARLHLRERRLSRSSEGGAVLTLDAASAELLVIDALGSNPSGADGVFTAANLKAAVASYVNDAFAGTPLTTIAVTGPASTTGPVDVPLAPHPWDALSDLADQFDVDIYDEGDEVIQVAPRPISVGETSHALTVGANGTILTSDTGITRDDWANWVTVWYEWTTAAGASQSAGGFATVTSGPYTVAEAGYKILEPVVRQMKGSTGAGNRAARTILRRMLARSRSYTLEAVPAWWLRPGDTITLQLPLGNQERHLVSRIGFRPGAMRIETRLPDTASPIGE